MDTTGGLPRHLLTACDGDGLFRFSPMNNSMPPPSLDQVPWWLWPTVLCLDAPLVAVSWQSLLARQVGARLSLHHGALLAIAVWLAYVADRWIEGWRLTPRTVRTRRHYFYMRWRWSAFATWVAMLSAGVALALAKLEPREWVASLGLLALVLPYLLSHQLLHRNHPARVPKEVCVAVLIAGGAVLYPATSRPEMWANLLPGFAWLVVLSLLNCLLISEWEREVDVSQGQESLAFGSASFGDVVRFLPAVAGLVALVFCFFGPVARNRFHMAATSSAFALWGLAKTQPRLGRERARVLVDAALLSPLIWLLFS